MIHPIGSSWPDLPGMTSMSNPEFLTRERTAHVDETRTAVSAAIRPQHLYGFSLWLTC
jgi:hypothetical protein